MKKLGLLAYSGGLDSTTLLYDRLTDIEMCVGFNYGSNHNEIELERAGLICKDLGILFKVIDMRKVFEDFKSTLLSGAENVAEGPYDHANQSELCVPFRNGIFMSILAGLAESRGLTRIYLASHNNDSAIYPDCTTAFNVAMKAAIAKGTYANIEVVTPYENISKADIVAIGLELRIPYEKTYSCYKGGSIHCGVCPTCIERREALGVFDLTSYER